VGFEGKAAKRAMKTIVMKTPTIASSMQVARAQADTGMMSPYPTVVIVLMEK
jgi:hypothetical protein